MQFPAIEKQNKSRAGNRSEGQQANGSHKWLFNSVFQSELVDGRVETLSREPTHQILALYHPKLKQKLLPIQQQWKILQKNSWKEHVTQFKY